MRIPMLVRHTRHRLLIQTPAKLNLYLEVLGRRADGFHELLTLIMSVRLYDTLRFRDEPAGQISLRCRGTSAVSTETIPTGEDNLALQAARLLKEHTGVERGAAIELWKRIPSAAGLGGGSSDAAATLVGLNRLWSLNLSSAELAGLAARLGSDIPFFLGDSTSAICRGRGESIEPVEIPAGAWFVVVRPPHGLSTADVYGHLRDSGEHSDRRPQAETTVRTLVRDFQRGRWGVAAASLHNALQVPAERLSGDVARLRAEFSRQRVYGHLMSGSGSAYFGLCAGRRHARRIALRFRAAGLGRVFVVSSGA